MKNILLILLIYLVFPSCTVGVSHKIIINDYSDSPDTLYQKKTKNYSIKIVNYPVDSIDTKEIIKKKTK